MKSLRVWAAVAYALGAVLCFGPATVQSERDAATHFEECFRRTGLSISCGAFGPEPIDGLAKAAVWPLWVSYYIARQLEDAR